MDLNKSQTLKHSPLAKNQVSISGSRSTQENIKEGFAKLMEEKLGEIRRLDVFGRGNLSKSPAKIPREDPQNLAQEKMPQYLITNPSGLQKTKELLNES